MPETTLTPEHVSFTSKAQKRRQRRFKQKVSNDMNLKLIKLRKEMKNANIDIDLDGLPMLYFVARKYSDRYETHYSVTPYLFKHTAERRLAGDQDWVGKNGYEIRSQILNRAIYTRSRQDCPLYKEMNQQLQMLLAEMKNKKCDLAPGALSLNARINPCGDMNMDKPKIYNFYDIYILVLASA